MTRAEALAAARRRWGERAGVWRDGVLYIVGIRGAHRAGWRDIRREIRGTGLSWAGAFANADARERGRDG